MSEKKRIPILPEGMSWAEDIPMPEIETVSATIRKVSVNEKGEIIEKTEVVELPKITENP